MPPMACCTKPDVYQFEFALEIVIRLFVVNDTSRNIITTASDVVRATVGLSFFLNSVQGFAHSRNNLSFAILCSSRVSNHSLCVVHHACKQTNATQHDRHNNGGRQHQRTSTSVMTKAPDQYEHRVAAAETWRLRSPPLILAKFNACT